MGGNVSIVFFILRLRPETMATDKTIPADQPGPEPADDRWHRILDETAKVFWKLGIKSVTMDDVATRLGISKKTLYQYVTDKNDLVDRVLKHLSTCYKCDIDLVRARKDQNAIDELYAVTTTVAGHLQGIHPSIHFEPSATATTSAMPDSLTAAISTARQRRAGQPAIRSSSTR